jgi:hypothetical protein
VCRTSKQTKHRPIKEEQETDGSGTMHPSMYIFRLLSKSSEKALINEQPVAAAVKTILDINMH